MTFKKMAQEPYFIGLGYCRNTKETAQMPKS